MATQSTDPQVADKRPLITVKTHILGTVRDFLRGNGLERNEAELRKLDVSDSASNYLVARAPARFKDDPGGVILTYDDPHCPVTLPAGRQFAFAHSGPFIKTIDAILPLEPLGWEQMQGMAGDINALFATAGWQRDRASPWDNEVITPELFLKAKASGSNSAGAGVWQHCSQPWVNAKVSVMHYNDTTGGAFMPPAGLSAPMPDDAPDRFLVRVYFSSFSLAENRPDPGPELKLLRDMRRTQVNGDAAKALPLSVWIDDPDWRPDDWIGTYVKGSKD